MEWLFRAVVVGYVKGRGFVRGWIWRGGGMGCGMWDSGQGIYELRIRGLMWNMGCGPGDKGSHVGRLYASVVSVVIG